MEQYYRDFGNWLRTQFPFRVQKISVNAGFTCPNRDGRTGYGGCIYCNNQTFNPTYCDNGKSITQQLEDGKQFFSRKYPDMKYLAYFQAYTNTYGSNNRLKALYEEALAVEDVVGLVIGTRPDCINDTLLDYFEELNRRTFRRGNLQRRYTAPHQPWTRLCLCPPGYRKDRPPRHPYRCAYHPRSAR